MLTNISIHEDDYCQVQLLPFENIEFILNEAEEIIGFKKENFNINGSDKIFVRKSPNFPLISKNIKFSDLQKVVEQNNFEKIINVDIGYGNSFNKSKTIGYGTDNCAILIDCDNEFVKNIWFNYYWNFTEIEKEKLSIFLIEINQLWNQILIDWNQSIIVKLTKNNIYKYLSN